ncbi:glycosyltransferase family 4 protein [Aliihoeflea sp. PC F10.4]
MPSGDRTMARLWLRALEAAGAKPVVASTFSSRDGRGDPVRQRDLMTAAELEAERVAKSLLAGPRPAAWFTYHNYYKAPDLVGPLVAGRLGIPYIIAEASSAPRRAAGPYALFSERADIATRAADMHFVVNGRDVVGLEALGAKGIVRCRPFIDVQDWPARREWAPSRPVRLIVAAMMRAGDKMASYRLLAEALADAPSGWQLEIVGDGPERAAVEALFRPFGEKVAFLGQIEQTELAKRFRAADLLVWPGINEAFGMVYLEAAASGGPALATPSGGVAEVVSHGQGGVISASADAPSYARALGELLSAPEQLVMLGKGAAMLARRDHALETAADLIRRLLPGLERALTGDHPCV